MSRDRCQLDDNWKIIFVTSPWNPTLWVLIRIANTLNIGFYQGFHKLLTGSPKTLGLLFFFEFNEWEQHFLNSQLWILFWNDWWDPFLWWTDKTWSLNYHQIFILFAPHVRVITTLTLNEFDFCTLWPADFLLLREESGVEDGLSRISTSYKWNKTMHMQTSELVFMKHYAPNYMLACKQNISQIKAKPESTIILQPCKGR